MKCVDGVSQHIHGEMVVSCAQSDAMQKSKHASLQNHLTKQELKKGKQQNA